MLVVLDTGALGMVTHPRASGENLDCNNWLRKILRDGHSVAVPEICDYELRRELLRADKHEGLERLNALVDALLYVPLSTAMMRLAAGLWASARKEGRPTASMEALDADVILAAPVLSLDSGERPAVVATTNVGHLARFIDARTWREIM
jgi:predicted nucleic acid-binding protein